MRFLLIVGVLVTWQGLVSAGPARRRDFDIDLFSDDGKGNDDLKIDLGPIEQIENSIGSAETKAVSSASSAGSTIKNSNWRWGKEEA